MWRYFIFLSRHPCITRSATLLIEDNDKGSSISTADLGFSDMGLFQSNTNVNNEIIAMSSPALMQNVVQRLNLDMNYACDGRFHDEVLYGTSQPVVVKMEDLSSNQSAALTLRIKADGAVELYDFVLSGEKLKHKESVKGKMLQPNKYAFGQGYCVSDGILCSRNRYGNIRVQEYSVRVQRLLILPDLRSACFRKRRQS